MSTAQLSPKAPNRRFAIAAIASAMLFSSVQAAPSLFSEPEARAGTAKAGTLETYNVEVATTALTANSATISIALPGMPPFEATRSIFNDAGSNATWRGRSAEGHDVLLTISGEKVRGRIYTGGASYGIAPDNAGGHTLSRLDPAALPSDRVTVPEIPYALVPEPKSVVTTSDSAQATVDVMVVFAAEVGATIPDQAGLNLFAQAAIDQTNLVLENSQVDSFRVRLVKAARVTRSGSGNPDVDLSPVRQDPQIAAMRAAAGADVVVFVGNYTQGFSGAAYKNTRPVQYGPVFAGFAYAIVDRAGVENSLVFVHELGHVLGMDHDVLSPHDPPADNSFPFAYGHISPRQAPYARGVLTVMAYQGSCGGNEACQQVPYFSNSNIAPPQAPFEGRAIGVLDQGENYRVAAIVGPITADFMTAEDILVSSFEEP
ncbi:MAG: zinc-dependent metalloprotease family protein [Lysobacterales bacterium]